MTSSEHLDILIIGAGISGICAAYYLRKTLPHKRVAILEARDALGGTWDLFRYPGVRSDSDMYTLGYSFHPWKHPHTIADGASILDYLHDTVETFGLARYIRFGQRVLRASWSSQDARWSVNIAHADGTQSDITCDFLWGCTGYYDYETGHVPDIPGLEAFEGDVIHPQHWDPELTYKDQRVVVLGSGATAVTLVPALAKQAQHVTMLQRSPTYILATPGRDHIGDTLRRWLPAQAAHHLIRWKNIALSMAVYQHARRWPEHARTLYIQRAERELEGHIPVEPHFTPRYEPWDQRLCLVPDGDLFQALRSGRASVVTGEIARVEADGFVLKSGETLPADILVTATGLKLQLMGGASLWVDGEPVIAKEHMMYKGAMLSDVPNMAMSVGYTNTSWTLKCELISKYVSRLLQRMEQGGHRVVIPRQRDASVSPEPLIDLSAGYIRRAQHLLPRQGSRLPWKLHQNYFLDRKLLGPQSDRRDTALEFT